MKQTVGLVQEQSWDHGGSTAGICPQEAAPAPCIWHQGLHEPGNGTPQQLHRPTPTPPKCTHTQTYIHTHTNIAHQRVYINQNCGLLNEGYILSLVAFNFVHSSCILFENCVDCIYINRSMGNSVMDNLTITPTPTHPCLSRSSNSLKNSATAA